MPPHKQPKLLSVIANSALALYFARQIQAAETSHQLVVLRDFFSSLPRVILETLNFWIVRTSFLIIKVETDVDDQVILGDLCHFISKVLEVTLQPTLKNIEQDFTIDLRNFTNFDVRNSSLYPRLESLRLQGIEMTSEPLQSDSRVSLISERFSVFLKSARHMETFVPGLFVTDRSREPRTVSLCFTSPLVTISLVRHCPNLTNLSLVGYEDLTDFVLQFISGEQEESPGLPLLEEISLPSRSFVTEEGVKSLLQHLPRLHTVKHRGNMGKVFDLSWEPIFGPQLCLQNFSQLMTISSGPVEGDDEEDEEEVHCWEPTKTTMEKIRRLCPDLKRFKVLLDDISFRELEPFQSITELEAHITWNGLTSGFERFIFKVGASLTSLDLTLLDNFSWTTISSLGPNCPLLTKLHLTLWREDMVDMVDMVDMEDMVDHEPLFPQVEDLKVKCEVYVDFLSEQVIEFFLHHCRSLSVLQLLCPLSWLLLEDLIIMFSSQPWLSSLEMLILANTSPQPMMLGLPAVIFLLDKCPALTVLGGLKTWRKVDYFDPESEFFFKSESLFSELKRTAVKENWDIDFDVENLDSVYSSLVSDRI